MKTKTLLIATAMFLALSAVAFSQAAKFDTSSTPITTVIATGNAEPVGDITFVQTDGTSVAGTITIQYGGNNVNITTPFSSIVINCTGNFAAACPTVLTTSIYSPGQLVLGIPGGVVTSTPASTFTVSGVRVQISGTGLTSLDASISATGNTITTGQTAPRVINGIKDGILAGSVASYDYTATPGAPIPDLSKGTLGTPIINAVNGSFIVNSAPNPGPRNTVIKVAEGFLGAWSKDVGIRITVSAVPPKGVTFTFPLNANSYDASTTANTAYNSWVRGGSTSSTAQTAAGVISSSSTGSGALSMYYYVATDIGNAVLETLEIPVEIKVDTTTASFPLSSTTFSYTITLAPVLAAYSSGVPINNKPRFTVLDNGPANLVQIAGSSTLMLIPYAYASKTALDFNTAMAIANTTEDPGISVLGLTGAIPQSGPVTFYLFPSNISTTPLPMFTYKTTAGSPGTGLDASGNVPSGGTYSVFLNQIFPEATPPTGSTATLGDFFQGYILIQTGFTNGHGMYVISNFTTLTTFSGSMYVLSNRTAFPEAVTF